MNEKMKDMYQHSEIVASMSAEVSNLAKTISGSMNYSLVKSEPSYHLVSLAEVLDEKAAQLYNACEELSGQLLLEYKGE